MMGKSETAQDLVYLGKLRDISDKAWLSIRGLRLKTIIPKSVIVEKDKENIGYYWIKSWFTDRIEDVDKLKSR